MTSCNRYPGRIHLFCIQFWFLEYILLSSDQLVQHLQICDHSIRLVCKIEQRPSKIQVHSDFRIDPILKYCFFRFNQVKMTSYWINPMTAVLIGRGKFGHRYPGGMPCDEQGRDWSYSVSSQGMPRMAGHQLMSGERYREAQLSAHVHILLEQRTLNNSGMHSFKEIKPKPK